jgi:hypothetical protein
LYKFKNLVCNVFCFNHTDRSIDIETQKKLREKYYHQDFQVFKVTNQSFQPRDVEMQDYSQNEFCLLKEEENSFYVDKYSIKN